MSKPTVKMGYRAWQVPSETKENVCYAVWYNEDSWHCTCTEFTPLTICSHIKRVQNEECNKNIVE